MICSKCGTELRENLKFCTNCGHETSVKAEDSEEIVDVTPITPVEDSKKRKKFKKVLSRVGIALACVLVVFISLQLAVILTVNVLMAIDDKIEKPTIKPVEHLELEYNGYSLSDIQAYETIRFYNLMRKNGLTDYTQIGFSMDYNYTAEDYKKMKGLDETYLYTIYRKTHDLDEFLEALGYSSLDEYLLKNNYVDEYGKPSTTYWRIETAKEISQMMLEESKRFHIE